ncbi:MAG: BatA domain-containing protein [Verrucomicrobiae bacterium]|jgi:hypothetical protein|nr:BatA domain-containing protein [Verrucomicrobiae bacterium]
MSFLAPLFLVGGLAVAAPILFHLIRRTTRDKTPFSSMMFLTPSPPRITKRSRLEHVFLLLLRCLVLLLLAAGFARPFFADAEDDALPAGPGHRVLILVDTSASMRRAGAWEAAAKLFDETLRETGPQDAVALYQFDRRLHPVVSFARVIETAEGARDGLLRGEFAKLKPGWGSTRLGLALTRAAGLLEEQEDEEHKNIPSRVVLISDLQQGAELSELQAFEWPEQYELKLRPVTVRNIANAGIQYLPPSPGDDEAKDRDRVKVRVFNSADAAVDQFRVVWADAAGKALGLPSEIYVPAGQNRVIALERPADESATRVLLSGDAEPFDNSAWIIPPRARVVQVVYSGTEKADDIKAPFFFLAGALPETPSFRFDLRRHEVGADLQPAGLTVVTTALSATDQKRLLDFLEAGGVAWFAPRDVEALGAAFQMLGAAPIGIEEVTPARYALLGEIDFRHPLFAPFADPRYGDFSKIHFWKYRRFPVGSLSNARLLASFDNEDPALVQVPVGKGFALIQAGCWHPSDSQLALSTKFVPLVYSILDLGGLLTRTPSQHAVGSAISIPFTNRADRVLVKLPDGAERTIETASFESTDEPGLYSITAGTNRMDFAVNLDPRESRTDRMAAEELERYGVTLHETGAQVESREKTEQLKHSELEQRQKLWRWLIAAALVLLSIEILMAGRLAKSPARASEPAA